MQSGSHVVVFTPTFFRRAIGLARLVNPLAGEYANERHPAIRALAQDFNAKRTPDRRLFVGAAALCDLWSVQKDRRLSLVQSETAITLAVDDLPTWPHAWALVSDRKGDLVRDLLPGEYALHFFISQSHPLWNRGGKRTATDVCGDGFTLRRFGRNDDYAAFGVEALLSAGRAPSDVPMTAHASRVPEAS